MSMVFPHLPSGTKTCNMCKSTKKSPSLAMCNYKKEEFTGWQLCVPQSSLTCSFDRGRGRQRKSDCPISYNAVNSSCTLLSPLISSSQLGEWLCLSNHYNHQLQAVRTNILEANLKTPYYNVLSAASRKSWFRVRGWNVAILCTSAVGK